MQVSCNSNLDDEQREIFIGEVEDDRSDNGNTGNSESTAVPYNVPIQDIETEMLAKFTSMAKRFQAVEMTPPRILKINPVAPPFKELNCWLNGKSKCADPHGAVPQRQQSLSEPQRRNSLPCSIQMKSQLVLPIRRRSIC